MLLISIVFVVLMVAGMPVAFATGIAGFVFFVVDGAMPLSVGVQKIASMSQSFPLLAVPFFVLAGHLMNESGITSRLLKVSMVAVGALADEVKGEIAKAYVVLKDGRFADERSIIEHCRRSLAPYKVPRAVQFVADLPKTSTGKITRNELAAFERSGV